MMPIYNSSLSLFRVRNALACFGNIVSSGKSRRPWCCLSSFSSRHTLFLSLMFLFFPFSSTSFLRPLSSSKSLTSSSITALFPSSPITSVIVLHLYSVLDFSGSKPRPRSHLYISIRKRKRCLFGLKMRYENWDVLLFPETSRVPIQEFKTQCTVTKGRGMLDSSFWVNLLLS